MTQTLGPIFECDICEREYHVDEGAICQECNTTQESTKRFQQVMERADKLEAERDRLLKVARVFLKNHHGHHPTLCIDGCDLLACGEGALIEALSAKGE